MADRAKITSFDTLEGFQNTLIVYLDKAKRVLAPAPGWRAIAACIGQTR